MKGHPLHGVNPLSEKIGRKCDWGTNSGWLLWKLERLCAKGGRREVHLSFGGEGRSTFAGSKHDAETRARQFPGWELRPG